MRVWLLQTRSLSFMKLDRVESFHYIIHPSSNEKEVVKWVKNNKFTANWWDEHLIINLQECGELWAKFEP